MTGPGDSVRTDHQIAADGAAQIAPLVKDGHQVLISHGNGPQVGNILVDAQLLRQFALLDPRAGGYWPEVIRSRM